MTKRQHVVVERHDVEGALTLPEVAVLFVIPDAHDHANETKARAHIEAQRAKRGFCRVLIEIEDPVFDVIGCSHLIHFQPRLGPVQFGTHCAENNIVAGLCSFLLSEPRRNQYAQRE